MKKKIIVYFAIFGLLFGLFNVVDAWLWITGGYDMPRSMSFNIPAMIVDQGVYSALNALEQSRFKALKKEVGLPPEARFGLTKKEWESLPPEKQQEYLSKMVQYKYLVRHDPLIGQNGLLKFFYQIYPFSYLLVSLIAWGMIGAIVYLISLVSTAFIRKRAKNLP